MVDDGEGADKGEAVGGMFDGRNEGVVGGMEKLLFEGSVDGVVGLVVAFGFVVLCA